MAQSFLERQFEPAISPDAESVRTAQRQIGMPMERVWACRPMQSTLAIA